MGMFDTIKCEYPLPDIPDPQIQNKEFQTKNFDNVMDSYLINEKGELFLHLFKYEEVPEEERPFYGKPEWEYFDWIGSVESIPIGDYFVDYTGIINFYTTLFDDGDEFYIIDFDKPIDYGWIEFEAKFLDGILIDIKLIEYRKPKEI